MISEHSCDPLSLRIGSVSASLVKIARCWSGWVILQQIISTSMIRLECKVYSSATEHSEQANMIRLSAFLCSSLACPSAWWSTVYDFSFMFLTIRQDSCKQQIPIPRPCSLFAGQTEKLVVLQFIVRRDQLRRWVYRYLRIH